MSSRADLFERLALHIPALQEPMLDAPLIHRSILVAFSGKKIANRLARQYDLNYEETVTFGCDDLIKDLRAENDIDLQAVAVCILQWHDMPAGDDNLYEELCLHMRSKICRFKCKGDQAQATRLRWSVMLAQHLNSLAYGPKGTEEILGNISSLKASLSENRIGQIRLAHAQVLKLISEAYYTLTSSDGFSHAPTLAHFAQQLETWFVTWKSYVSVRDDPFEDNYSSTPYDTSLILLLPYLFCLALVYRKSRSYAYHIASSFIAGILTDMKTRGSMDWLSHSALVMFISGTAENFSRSKGDPHFAESAAEDLAKLENVVTTGLPVSTTQQILLSDINDFQSVQAESSRLVPLFPEQKACFRDLNYAWCSVPRSYIVPCN